MKLGNIVVDRRSQAVTITILFGKHLMREDDLLKGPARLPRLHLRMYSAANRIKENLVICGHWVLFLYTMLHGQFPLYDNVPQELFNKDQGGRLHGPDDGRVSVIR